MMYVMKEHLEHHTSFVLFCFLGRGVKIDDRYRHSMLCIQDFAKLFRALSLISLRINVK